MFKYIETEIRIGHYIPETVAIHIFQRQQTSILVRIFLFIFGAFCLILNGLGIQNGHEYQ